jgi:unsaturated rhamnogalacturonyl hydrolase
MNLVVTLALVLFAVLPNNLLRAAAKAPQSARQPTEFTDWPAGMSPREIGKRVAERFLAVPRQSTDTAPSPITYPEACTWYGALTFAQLSADQGLSAQLIKRFDPLLREPAMLVPKPDHVDNTVFGVVPLQIYRETREKRYLDMGLQFADKQWDNPSPGGLTRQSRFWIDDMFMITAVQVQAYRATGQQKYVDRAALEMTAYLDKLQQPDGLFFHAPDAPIFWVAATVGSLPVWRSYCNRCHKIILDAGAF